MTKKIKGWSTALRTVAYVGWEDPRHPCVVTIQVDWEKLGRMLADRAIKAKTRKATMMFGAIKATVKDHPTS